MTSYRLAIEEIKDSEAITSYTRWVDVAQLKGADGKEVYVTFSPRFERIWLESMKAVLEFAAQKPAAIRLRSKYAIRLYAWAKQYVSIGTRRISLEELRKVLGLESVRDAAGNIIREAPLAVWANLRQRALDVALAEINAKADLNITVESLERSAHRRVTTLIFAIRTQAVPNGDSTRGAKHRKWGTAPPHL